MHVVIITGAVYATAHAGIKNQKEKVEKLKFVQVKKAPEPPKPKPQEQLVAPPPPKGFQTLAAPINIPDVIPSVDLTKKVTDEADFTGKGVQGGNANGKAGGVRDGPAVLRLPSREAGCAVSRQPLAALSGHAADRRHRG